MTEHVIPNMNPNLMLGVWIEQTDNDNEPAELDVHPIIGFIMSTTLHETPASVPPDEHVDSAMVSVISPTWPDGMPIDHEQFRLYDMFSGHVYNAIGDTDPIASKYMRENPISERH